MNCRCSMFTPRGPGDLEILARHLGESGEQITWGAWGLVGGLTEAQLKSLRFTDRPRDQQVW